MLCSSGATRPRTQSLLILTASVYVSRLSELSVLLIVVLICGRGWLLGSDLKGLNEGQCTVVKRV